MYLLLFSSRYLTPEQKLLITLRFMASGSMQLVVADVVRVSAPTVCRILPKVCIALIAHLHTFIKMPMTAREREDAAAQFYAFAQFPRTIGAIDCTHVKLQSPGGNLVRVHLCGKLFQNEICIISLFYRFSLKFSAIERVISRSTCKLFLRQI